MDAIFPRVLSPERGVPVKRVIGIEDHDGKLSVHVPELGSRLLARKFLPRSIVTRTKKVLNLTLQKRVNSQVTPVLS